MSKLWGDTDPETYWHEPEGLKLIFITIWRYFVALLQIIAK